MRQEELRIAILDIAKGEVAPLPYYKRHVKQDPLMFNQDLVDAVLTFSETNRNKSFIYSYPRASKEITKPKPLPTVVKVFG